MRKAVILSPRPNYWDRKARWSPVDLSRSIERRLAQIGGESVPELRARVLADLRKGIS